MSTTITSPAIPQMAAPPPSPYKGLVPYTEEDAAFFFGREEDREIIISNLLAWRLTLLYGTSGVGKSSVLGAGVVAQLNHRAHQNLEQWGTPGMVVVYFNTWRDDPVAGLVAAVEKAVRKAWEGEKTRFAPLLPGLTLSQQLTTWAERAEGELLIILDQFEEFLLYHPNDEGPAGFANQFPQAVNQPGLPVNFLIAIREDALAKLDLFKEKLPNLFDNYLRITALNSRMAEQAIALPLQEYNRRLPPGANPAAIEPALVREVLRQVKAGQVTLGEAGRANLDQSQSRADNDEIEAPYLQLVMERLWEREQTQNSSVLRLQTLNELGGAERIVRTHLDEVLRSFSDLEQDAAARMFRHLVTTSGGKFAQTAADLADLTELPVATLEPILEKLCSSGIRILRPVAPPPDQAGGLRYEVFHDVLAAAILDWRRRFTEQQRLQRQARDERDKVRRRTIQLVSFVFAFTPLAILLIVAFIFSVGTNSADTSFSDDLTFLLKSANDRLENYLAGRTQDLAAIATNPNLVSNNAGVRDAALQNYLNIYKDYSYMGVANANGVMVASASSKGNVNTTGQNVSNQDWFKQIKQSSQAQFWVSGPASTPESQNSSNTLLGKKTTEVLVYGIAIRDTRGTLLGVINAQLDFNTVHGLLDGLSNPPRYVALLNSQMQPLLPLSFDSASVNSNEFLQGVLFHLQPAGKLGRFVLSSGGSGGGEYLFMTYEVDQKNANIPNGWKLMAYQKRPTIFDDKASLVTAIALAFVVGLVLLILINVTAPWAFKILSARRPLIKVSTIARSRRRRTIALVLACILAEAFVCGIVGLVIQSLVMPSTENLVGGLAAILPVLAVFGGYLISGTKSMRKYNPRLIIFGSWLLSCVISYLMLITFFGTSNGDLIFFAVVALLWGIPGLLFWLMLRLFQEAAL